MIDNSIIDRLKEEYQRAIKSHYGDVWLDADFIKSLLELYETNPPPDPASFSDPRAPVEAEDVRRVLDIIRSNDDLFIRFEYLRARLRAGEDVTGDLITFGYLIAKTEGSKEDEKKHKKDNCGI